MPKITPTNIGVILAIAAAFCWGIATVMSKHALDGFAPIPLLNIQLIASVIALWSVVIITKPKNASIKTTCKFASLGILEPCLAYALGLTGLVYIQASIATIIIATEAVMIIILSVLIFKEKVNKQFWLLSIIALFGVVLVLDLDLSTQLALSTKESIGVLLVLAGTASAAFYVVLSNKFVTQTNPILIVTYQQTFALILAIALLTYESNGFNGNTYDSIPPITNNNKIWLIAITSGIIQYALAFSLYLAAMKRLNITVVGNMLNMIPIFGLTAAFLFLNEQFSTIQMIGSITAITAITLITRLKKQKA